MCVHIKRFIILIYILQTRDYSISIKNKHLSIFLTTYFGYSLYLTSVQFSSVAQSCPTLCDPMNRSRPGLPVHHQLPESTQIHVHRVSDAIQPSHPVVPFSSCPQSLPALESYKRLFTIVSSSFSRC